MRDDNLLINDPHVCLFFFNGGIINTDVFLIKQVTLHSSNFVQSEVDYIIFLFYYLNRGGYIFHTCLLVGLSAGLQNGDYIVFHEIFIVVNFSWNDACVLIKKKIKMK